MSAGLRKPAREGDKRFRGIEGAPLPPPEQKGKSSLCE